MCGDNIGRTSWKDRRKVCNDCNKNTVDWSKVTYGEVKGLRKYQKNSRIRGLTRTVYLNSTGPRECKHCGYDKHFEVCHIKGISTHDDKVFVSTINSLDNLVALCRNCHWELDHGRLTL